MRNTALMFLGMASVLAAVEWDVQQVTHGTNLSSDMAELILTEDGVPRILYYEMDPKTQQGAIKTAIPSDTGWVIVEVAKAKECLFSCDLDIHGTLFVAFAEIEGPGAFDIFLANDSSYAFEVVNLTDDSEYQLLPVIKIDDGGIMHIAYLVSEEVVDFFCEGGIDMSLDSEGLPYIFFSQVDGAAIWYARPSENEDEWDAFEIVQDPGISDFPIAVLDDVDNIHLVYEEYSPPDGFINYTSNESGEWKQEVITTGPLDLVYASNSCIALDPEGKEHVVWVADDVEGIDDIFCAHRVEGEWIKEPVTGSEGIQEEAGFGHYFTIDDDGYGHLVCAASDEGLIKQIYYAKSTEPLTDYQGIESPAKTRALRLKVREKRVHFFLPHSGSVNLDLYDASGRRVEHIASGSYPAGEHTVPINSSSLSTGIYFVRAEVRGQAAGAKFILAR
jgi:hypothetical protein